MKASSPAILHAPMARAALARGMDQMTALLRPTLGPLPRVVAIAPIVGSSGPEILDSAATIARRTIQLADPFENMGGMLVRHLVWHVFEAVGDGTATAAVLAQALMHEAATFIAAGGDPMLLKRGIERGLAVALGELRRQARDIDQPAQIAALVEGIVREPDVAAMIGEVMDSVGPDGAVLVEDSQGSQTRCDYLDGVTWNEGYVSSFLLRNGETTVPRILNPRIFVTDHALNSAEQLVPALEACVEAGERNLLVIAPEVRDSALALMIVNRERGKLDGALAVKAPSFGPQRTHILEDIAVLTGGRCVREGAGERLADVRIDDLGRARQAWASRSSFGILGGEGRKDVIRKRVAEARAELSTVEDDDYVRNKIRERIGKLLGAAAVISVAAGTRSVQAEQHVRIEAALAAARSALRSGVAAGGGAAFLACVPALEALPVSRDEAMGAAILARALAEPMRTIASNAGFDPAPILHAARQRGPGWTFDVQRREWADAWQSGILDPVEVLTTALETGVSAATLAMTTEVLIRPKKPAQSLRP